MGPPITTPSCSPSMPTALVGSPSSYCNSSLWSSFSDCSSCPSPLMSDPEHWGGSVRRRSGSGSARALRRPSGRGWDRPQARGRCVDERAGGTEGNTLRRCRDGEVAGVGDERLPTLHVRPGAPPAGDRDRGDGKSAQGDRFPDGAGRHPHARRKPGGRDRGLRDPLLAGTLSTIALPLMLAWSIWHLIFAWRMKEPDQ